MNGLWTGLAAGALAGWLSGWARDRGRPSLVVLDAVVGTVGAALGLWFLAPLVPTQSPWVVSAVALLGAGLLLLLVALMTRAAARQAESGDS